MMDLGGVYILPGIVFVGRAVFRWKGFWSVNFVLGSENAYLQKKELMK